MTKKLYIQDITETQNVKAKTKCVILTQK